MPTSTRSFTHLLSAEAGVSADLPAFINGTGNISPSVNGTRTTSTSLFFNGIDATNITSNEGSMSDNISPAPEMLDEVKLQTSLYDASTGRSGEGNFQLITRSGTNSFRGGGIISFQHENFNSNDFFFEREGSTSRRRAATRGFTAGGPIGATACSSSAAIGMRLTPRPGSCPRADLTVLPAALRRSTARAPGEPVRRLPHAQCRDHRRDPEGAVRESDRHRLHLRRRAGAVQPAQSSHRRLRDSGAAQQAGQLRQRCRRQRQSAGAAAQRRAGRVQAGSARSSSTGS